MSCSLVKELECWLDSMDSIGGRCCCCCCCWGSFGSDEAQFAPTAEPTITLLFALLARFVPNDPESNVCAAGLLVLKPFPFTVLEDSNGFVELFEFKLTLACPYWLDTSANVDPTL